MKPPLTFKEALTIETCNKSAHVPSKSTEHLITTWRRPTQILILFENTSFVNNQQIYVVICVLFNVNESL